MDEAVGPGQYVGSQDTRMSLVAEAGGPGQYVGSQDTRMSPVEEEAGGPG